MVGVKMSKVTAEKTVGKRLLFVTVAGKIG